MSSPPRKPDFSNVRSDVGSTESIRSRPDFSNVRSTVHSTEELLGDTPTREYTVVEGDSLSRIAKRCYGRASGWPAIYDANRDQLSDPDRIYPGQVLKIPSNPH